mmetsp:Transcript_122279/g.182737  ORF Transcript_122279/g.182737 Transcript_122279/m.182737 type:complete len:224 (-) Transcript_122279:669-1340(-)
MEPGNKCVSTMVGTLPFATTAVTASLTRERRITGSTGNVPARTFVTELAAEATRLEPAVATTRTPTSPPRSNSRSTPVRRVPPARVPIPVSPRIAKMTPSPSLPARIPSTATLLRTLGTGRFATLKCRIPSAPATIQPSCPLAAFRQTLAPSGSSINWTTAATPRRTLAKRRLLPWWVSRSSRAPCRLPTRTPRALSRSRRLHRLSKSSSPLHPLHRVPRDLP